MLERNLCERCHRKVHTAKARHKQTKYCVECAKAKKRENTLDPWTPEKRREYMREYMKGYRAQARLNCVVWVLPLLGVGGLSAILNLSFEEITAGITYAEILAVKGTGLAFIVIICIRHLKHAWNGGGQDKKQ
jgi:hypothetical protein